MGSYAIARASIERRARGVNDGGWEDGPAEESSPARPSNLPVGQEEQRRVARSTCGCKFNVVYTGRVDLTLTSRGDYVVRAAIALAHAWDGNGAYRKIRDVAAEMDLPPSYTPQLLGILAKAGLAEAKAGRDGGYRLARRPKDVTLLEVIEAAEGHLVSRRCPMRGGPCRWDDVCALHPTWLKTSEAIRSTLARTSLEDVTKIDRKLERGEVVGSAPGGHRRPSPHRHAR